MTSPRVDRIPQLRDLERARCDHTNARLIATLTPDHAPIPTNTKHYQASPGDLRGIPVQAPGVGGAIPGTRPDTRHA